MPNTPKRWFLSLAGLALLMALIMTYCGETRPPLLVMSGPTGLVSFQIAQADGEVLWSIAADEPTTLTRIDYGSIPKGFHQLVPPNDESPRFLMAAEWLEIEMISAEGTFFLEGQATSPETFQTMNHKLELQTRPRE